MDWEPVTTALIKVVVLSFLVERALAVLFDAEKVQPALNRLDLKPWIAIAVSIGACFALRLDALTPLGAQGAALAQGSALQGWGYFLTGLVVAGGSAGAVKLFQDVLGFRRSSRDELKIVKALEHEATAAEATARVEKAKAEIASAKAVITAADARVAAAAYPGDSPEQQILIARMAERDLRIARGV